MKRFKLLLQGSILIIIIGTLNKILMLWLKLIASKLIAVD